MWYNVVMFNEKEYKKQYYIKNREKLLKKDKEKYIRNRKDILQARKKARALESATKRAERLAYLKLYRIKNMDVLRQKVQSTHSKRKQYAFSASRRGYEFSLDDSQFETLFDGSCFYCNKPNSRGIDRVNNLIGYTSDNSVSCCEMCNKMKWKFSQKDFLEKIKQIYTNHSM